jgi:hypothetical protein
MNSDAPCMQDLQTARPLTYKQKNKDKHLCTDRDSNPYSQAKWHSKHMYINWITFLEKNTELNFGVFLS